MRDQYAGDVTDLIKIAFLRALCCNQGILGVAWYYAPGDDGRPDGRHLEWRTQLGWRKLDPELFDSLSTMPVRSVAALESLPIWPSGTLFHHEAMPLSSLRTAWATRMREALTPATLVFLDPDNGLGSHREKHATYEEVHAFRNPERAQVFISFPGRTSHEIQIKDLHEKLKSETGAAFVFTLITSVAVEVVNKNEVLCLVPRIRWFTVIDANPAIAARVRTFAATLSTMPRAKARVVGDGFNN